MTQNKTSGKGEEGKMQVPLLPELEKMSKQELQEIIRSLDGRIYTQSDLDNVEHLTHELQVHQIELEMQNRELREAQQEIELARDRYADLYDFAPVSYMSCDSKGIIKNINLTGAKMLDLPRANILDRAFFNWIETSNVGKYFSYLRDVLQDDTKITTEMKIRDQHGNVLDVHIESIRSWSRENNCFLCQSVILDITENKQAQREIFRKTRHLKLITDALPIQISYLNLQYEHVFTNKAYAEWFNSSSSEIIDENVIDIWGQDNYSKIQQQLDVAFLGKKITFDLELSEFDNDNKYICISLIPDFDIDNSVHGVIVLFRDITVTFTEEVEDRQRLLESSKFHNLRAMEEMAIEIAHELNQPLAAISIYSDACRRMLESSNAQPKKIIQTLIDIRVQAERASEVIRRIRAFVCNKKLNLEETNFNEIIKEVAKLLKVELRSHSVKLTLDLAINLPLIALDRILIEQVVLNLSRNAMEAMDVINSSQRFLKISTSVGKPNGIEVSVEDSGPGMTNEEIKKVFEPFYTTKENGTGLGLVICNSIIKAHQGRLWVVPGEHGGSVFSFYLTSDSMEN